jgi:hypothetical protein
MGASGNLGWLSSAAALTLEGQLKAGDVLIRNFLFSHVFGRESGAEVSQRNLRRPALKLGRVKEIL